MGPRTHILNGVQITEGEGAIFGVVRPVVKPGELLFIAPSPHPLTDFNVVVFKWVKYNQKYMFLYIPLFEELTYRSDPSTDFHA